MLSHLLHLAGIESVILENRSRDYIESRIRAGLLEQWATDLLIDTGVGERLKREAMFHDGITSVSTARLHHINFRKLIGKGVDHLRPAGGGEGPGRAAAGGRRADPVRGVRRQRPRRHRQRAEDPLSRHDGKDQELDLRFHRRLRRLPRHLPAEHSGDRAHGLRPRISVRLGRHPLEVAAARGRTDLRLQPARLRALHHALADVGAALFPVRGRRRHRELAGRAHLAGAARPPRRHPAAGRGPRCCRRASPPCAASWSSRCSTAGCSWPAIPPHPAADRRQGHEPRARRREGAVARARGVSTAPDARTCWSAIRRPACGGSGRRSASRGG